MGQHLVTHVTHPIFVTHLTHDPFPALIRGNPSLSAMSPFDSAHTTSYSSLIETIRLSCTVYEI